MLGLNTLQTSYMMGLPSKAAWSIMTNKEGSLVYYGKQGLQCILNCRHPESSDSLMNPLETTVGLEWFSRPPVQNLHLSWFIPSCCRSFRDVRLETPAPTLIVCALLFAVFDCGTILAWDSIQYQLLMMHSDVN